MNVLLIIPAAHNSHGAIGKQQYLSKLMIKLEI